MHKTFNRFLLIVSFLGLVRSESNLYASTTVVEEIQSVKTPTAHPRTLNSIAHIPIDFITTLFDPFINSNAQEFYGSQLTSVKKEGVTAYTADKIKRMLTVVKDHPLSTVTLIGGIATGYTSLGEDFPALPIILTSVNNAKLGKQTYDMAVSIPSSSYVNFGGKAILMAGAIYLIASVPVASALEFNSYAQAKAYYDDTAKSCHGSYWNQLRQAGICLEKEGSSLHDCQSLITQGNKDVYSWTRHPSTDSSLDPVSIVHIGIDGKTCIQSALTPEAPVTEVCFTNAEDVNSFSVRIREDLNLREAYQGLEIGKSTRHIGVDLKFLHHPYQMNLRCGTFHPTEAKYNLGEKSICVLTLRPGKDVAQVCIDPQRPDFIVLRKAEDVKLVFNNDGMPATKIIKNPIEQGLNIKPDLPRTELLTAEEEASQDTTKLGLSSGNQFHKDEL